MQVWGAILLTVIFLGGGVFSLHIGRQTARKKFIFTGVILTLFSLIGILYIGAAFLLIESLK